MAERSQDELRVVGQKFCQRPLELERGGWGGWGGRGAAQQEQRRRSTPAGREEPRKLKLAISRKVGERPGGDSWMRGPITSQ